MTSRSRSAADTDVDPEAHVPQQSHSIFDAIERTFRPTVFRSSAGAAHQSDEEVERRIPHHSFHRASCKRHRVVAPSPLQPHHGTGGVGRHRGVAPAGGGEERAHGGQVNANGHERALANLKTAKKAADGTLRELGVELTTLEKERRSHELSKQQRQTLAKAIRETKEALKELETDEENAKRVIGEAGGGGGGARGAAPGGRK